MVRDWKGSCIFRDVASHTATCFSSGRALAVLAKDGAVLAPRWRSLPTIQAGQTRGSRLPRIRARTNHPLGPPRQ